MSELKGALLIKLLFCSTGIFSVIIQVKKLFETSKITRNDYTFTKKLKKGRNFDFQGHIFSNCIFNLTMSN